MKMKTKNLILVAIALVGLNLTIIAQWQTSGNDIYFNSGNVGINTATPGGKLHVHDGILRTSLPLNGQGILLSFCDKSGTQGDTYHFYADFSGANQDGNWISLADEWNNNIQTWRNASVGIGTTNPQAKLDVNGDILISNSLGGLILTSPNGSQWKLIVDDEGNLSTSPTVNISENKREYNFNIYPNPAKDEINIEILSNNMSSFKAEILDINGKSIISSDFFSNSTNINISTLTKGIYLLTLKSDDEIILKTQRIIKN
jgi:hypothetical protein